MKMKKTFKFLTLTVLLSMVGAVSAFAQQQMEEIQNLIGYTFDGNGVRFKVLSITWGADNSKLSKGTVAVTSNLTSLTVDELNIPSTFKKQLTGWYNGNHHIDEVTFTVTTVSTRAFENLTVLDELIIPGTVTTIEDGAFNGITNVTELTIGTPEEKSELTTLGDFVFGNTPIGTLDLSNCPKLDLGNGTTPFLNAYGGKNLRLKTVKLPNEIENIGVAFANITNLSTLDLSKTHVNVLEPGALENTSLHKIVLPAVPDKTTASIKIGKGAFAGSPVDTLIINGPIAALDAIDKDAFIGMAALKYLELNGDLKTANAMPYTTTNDGANKGAFPDSPLLDQVIVKGKVSANGAIASGAFINKTNLKNILFDNDIAAGGIGANAFENAGTAATELTIAFNGKLLGAAAIGKEAFKGTNKVSTLTFKKDVAAGAIAERAFEKTGSCATVTFEGELLGSASIGKRAFSEASISSLTFSKDIAAAAWYGENGGIAEEAFFQMSKSSTCAATVLFGGELLGMKAVGEKAFYQAKISSLTFAKDIAGASIGQSAFQEITGKAPVVFKGNLNGDMAIYKNAFMKADLESVTFEGNIKSGAIYADGATTGAFYKAAINSKLSFGTATSGGNIESNGICDYAFEELNGNAEIEFNGKLTGNAAIGNYAFTVANAKKVTFVKPINYAAIDAFAFNKLNTHADRAAADGVFFQGDLIGDYAIGSRAFYQANVAKMNFKNISGKHAIGEQAFEEAGNAAKNATILIDGDVTGEYGIDNQAFLNAKAQSVEITGNVEANQAIYNEAFKGTNLTSLKIKGNIKGSPAIGGSAFEGNPLTTINLAWDETPKTITATADDFDYAGVLPARRSEPGQGQVITLPINNLPIDFLPGNFDREDYESDDDACDEDADDTPAQYESPVVDDPLPAIWFNAFKNVKATGETTLNLGSIKSTMAIAPGAFAGAEIEIVNFNELMAPWAIAPYQFAEISITSDGASNLMYAAATLKTVNFKKEFKDSEELDAENANLVGPNAFTGTKVSTVNFPKVSVKRAIIGPSKNSNSQNYPSLKFKSPFYKNGADMTLNFDYDVCTSGFGPNAFSESNTVVINLANSAVFEKLAFEEKAFDKIAPVQADADKNFVVTINYNKPADEINVFRAFAVKDFAMSEQKVDIQFITVPAVVAKYTTESNASDLTPYRIKFISRKYIKMMPADGYYFGFFAPEDEQYIIEKYQPMGPSAKDEDAPTGKTAGVYSAYYDDKTLKEVTEDDPSTPQDDTHFYPEYGGGQKYTADLYMNPLRVQDYGKYVLNQGHTFIVTSNTADDVVAYQSIDERDGGVQTFAGLDPWACNDLRWNPNKIWARYACCGTQLNPFFTYTGDGKSRFGIKDGKFIISKDENGNFNGNYALKPGHEWAGEMSYVAIENDDIDFYGNQVNQYQVFVAMSTDDGVAFSNAPMIPADYAYVLVTDNKDKRIDYSGNNIYPVSASETNAWKSLIEKLNQMLKDKDYEAPEYNGDETSWFNQVITLLEELGYEEGYKFRVEGEDEDHKNDKQHEQALISAFKKIFGDIDTKEVPVQQENADGQPLYIDASTGELTTTAEGNEPAYAIKVVDGVEQYDGGKPVYETKTVFEYKGFKGDMAQLAVLFGKLCEAKQQLAVALDDLAEADVIDCIDENSDLYQTFLKDENLIAAALSAGVTIEEFVKTYVLPTLNGQKFSQVLGGYEATKKEKQDQLDAINEILTKKASNDAEYGDDLYKQYLAILNDGDTRANEIKQQLEDEKTNADAEAKLFADYEDAAEALAEDDHAKAVYDGLDWGWFYDFTTSVNEGGADVNVAEGKAQVKGLKTIDEKLYFNLLVKTNAPLGGVPAEEAASFVGKNFYVKAADLNGGEEPATAATTVALEKAIQSSVATTPLTLSLYDETGTSTEWKATLSAYAYDYLYPTAAPLSEESLHSAAEPGVDEKKLVENMAAANKALVAAGKTYSVEASIAAKHAAILAAAKAKGYAFEWYTKAVSAQNENAKLQETYDMVKNALLLEEIIRQLDNNIKLYQKLPCYGEEGIDGTYADAVARVGRMRQPAVNAVEVEYELDADGQIKIVDGMPVIKTPAQPGIDEVPASGAYLAIETAAKNLSDFLNGTFSGDVAALYEAIIAVPEDLLYEVEASPARLNIIWTDRDERNDVVGIMEAVVKGKANASVNNNAIYNLNGMRVKNATKGVFIQNGKKIIK